MSLHSPKSKYRGEIVFDTPRQGLGSTVSYTNDDIDYLRKLLESQAPGHIIIRENKSVYPSFDWVIVEDYYTNGK